MKKYGDEGGKPQDVQQPLIACFGSGIVWLIAQSSLDRSAAAAPTRGTNQVLHVSPIPIMCLARIVPSPFSAKWVNSELELIYRRR
jgi:hypothetical protein